MASVFETIKFGLLEYPGLNKSAADVLSHIFCTNGNGFYWVRGEPVCNPGPGSRPYGEIVAGELLGFEKRIAEYEEMGLPTIDLRRELADYRFVVENIDEMAGEMQIRSSSLSGSLYPACDYAKILNIPDDVTDDWLECAHTFTESMTVHLRQKELGDRMSNGDRRWLSIMIDTHKRLDDKMVDRGLIASMDERNALADRIIGEILAEEKASSAENKTAKPPKRSGPR